MENHVLWFGRGRECGQERGRGAAGKVVVEGMGKRRQTSYDRSGMVAILERQDVSIEAGGDIQLSEIVLMA